MDEADFEGLESPTVIYFPDTNTFETDPTDFVHEIDEGDSMFRQVLRNEYPTPQPPYAPGPGWWDGDGADPANTDRQRVEPKGIVGLGHQGVDQTFEYSFDFRTDPTFQATSDFCHIFQLKALDGDDSPPLATISLYKNGSGIQGRVDCFTDGTSGTPQTEIIPTTFNYTAGQWIHFDIRITPCAQGESTGEILLSVNGGPFTGIANAAIDLADSTTYRPKFGFYRGMSTSNGVPVGDSWVEHRTITGYIGTSNILTWAGGANNNTWDTGATANFLNGSASSVFNTIDQVNFTGATNTTVNLSGDIWPDFADVNSSANYTFAGSGSITGGTLRKDGTGTLTLATTNSYPGLTLVTNGTLYVTGSIGNDSLADVEGGTLKIGSTTALGSDNPNGIQIAGGTLDVNGFGIGSIAVQVQGSGVGGAGAIINSGAQQTSAMSNVTLTADTTFGGTGRWDLRGSGNTLSTGGSAFNLTKTGTNQISFVGTGVDPALANITINQGILAFQTSVSSMGNPADAVTVASGAILGFYNTSAVMNKNCTLNGGTMWAQSGTTGQNVFSGPITLGSGGGILDAGSALAGGSANAGAVLTIGGAIGGSGALTKNGPGTVTLGVADTFGGPTTVNAGTLVADTNSSIPTNTALTIAAGAAVDLVNHASNPKILLQLASLSLSGSTNAWSGHLDLSNNDLIVHNGSLANITNQIEQGYNGGPWTGVGGITSSVAATITNTALGVELNSNGSGPLMTSFDSQAVTSTDVLVKYTYVGDANLDGVVNGSDYTLIDNGFNSHLTGWRNGDFNYDGVVNGDDYTLIDNAFNTQGPSLAGAAAGETSQVVESVPVPEPVGMGVLALAVASLHRRRRGGR